MDIIISAKPQGSVAMIPVDLLFWGFVIAYVLHILEESVLGDVFVEKVKRLYWTAYSWSRFAGFNAALLFLNILAVVLFETFGGAWLIFPLTMATERTLNGFYHLYETIKTKQFSSGLLTSVIFWIFAYLLIRYSIAMGEIPSVYLMISLLLGALIEVFMIGSLLFPPLRKRLPHNKIVSRR